VSVASRHSEDEANALLVHALSCRFSHPVACAASLPLCFRLGAGVNEARSRQFGVARRLIGWIAAYAFVLYVVLAGALAAQLAVSAHASFEICLNDIDGVPSPGHTQGQHEDCAIHCATVIGAVPALALALLQLLFWPRVQVRPRQFVFSCPREYLRRAGMSRAPPLPA
jgi:hypothetical protein